MRTTIHNHAAVAVVTQSHANALISLTMTRQEMTKLAKSDSARQLPGNELFRFPESPARTKE
jgi:hypothetical protein